MTQRRWSVAFIAMTASLHLYAEDGALRMSLEQMFATAEQHNASIQSFQSAIDVAQQGIDVAKSAWRPDVEGSASISYLGNVRIWDRPFKDGFTAKTPHFGNNFALMARQTVYSGGAITSGINLAKLGKQMAEADADANRQRVRFLLTGHYLQLHNLQNQQEVFEQNIALTQTLIDHTQNRMKEGIALKNDITRYELQLENLRLAKERVMDAQRIISHQLTTALGIDTTVVILPQDNFSEALCPRDGEAGWQQLAASNSTALQKALLGIKINEEKVKLERSERLPKIALVAEDHLDGPVTIEVPTLDNNYNYWFVGLGVSYQFSSLWKNNKRMRQARTNVEHSRRQQREVSEGIENGIQAAYTNYLTSFTELRTQEKSVELAAENYSIIRNRYENGLALVTDMVDAANVKLDAELALINARIDVIYNYYQLKYISETL